MAANCLFVPAVVRLECISIAPLGSAGRLAIIHVALELMDRLDIELAESFRLLEVRGPEITDLLPGAVHDLQKEPAYDNDKVPFG